LILVEQVKGIQKPPLRPCPTPLVLTKRSRADDGPAWRTRELADDAPKRIVARCNRRKCPACGPQWARKTKAALLAGLRTHRAEMHTAFLTVTAPGQDGGLADGRGYPIPEAIEEWNDDAADRWNHLRTRLRQIYPMMEFFRVGELQERGAIHYHIIARNIPGLSKETLSGIAVQCGFGFIADVRPMRHAAGVAAYLAKYLLKDVHDWPQGARVFSCSNKWREREHWYPNHLRRDGGRRGTLIMQPVGGGDPWVSVSPYEFNFEETMRLRKLRSALLAGTSAQIDALPSSRK